MVATMPESMHHIAMTELLKVMEDVDAVMICSTINAQDMRKLCYIAGYLSDVYGPPYSEYIGEFMGYVSGDFYGYMQPRKRRRVV